MASSIAKEWDTSTVLFPRRGSVASSRRKRAGWRSRSEALGSARADIREVDERTRPKARRAVSLVLQYGLARTSPTGMSSRLSALPIVRAWRRPSALKLRCRVQSRRSRVSSDIEKSVAAWRNTRT